jgi:hypothetical protein
LLRIDVLIADPLAHLQSIQHQEHPVPTQIVMDATGDTRHVFDAADQAAVASAERRFKELTAAGFTAARRTGPGTTELARAFDPNATETLFIPRLVGG